MTQVDFYILDDNARGNRFELACRIADIFCPDRRAHQRGRTIETVSGLVRHHSLDENSAPRRYHRSGCNRTESRL